MSKIIFVVDHNNTTLRTLHRIIGLRDYGMVVEVVGIKDIASTGKRPEMVIVDDLYMDPKKLRISDDVIEPKDCRTMADHQRNRGRASKGDRHKNKRFRWSE